VLYYIFFCNDINHIPHVSGPDFELDNNIDRKTFFLSDFVGIV